MVGFSRFCPDPTYSNTVTPNLVAFPTIHSCCPSLQGLTWHPLFFFYSFPPSFSPPLLYFTNSPQIFFPNSSILAKLTLPFLLQSCLTFGIQAQKTLIVKYKYFQWVARVLCILLRTFLGKSFRGGLAALNMYLFQNRFPTRASHWIVWLETGKRRPWVIVALNRSPFLSLLLCITHRRRQFQ